MSDLKHQTQTNLELSLKECLHYIKHLKFQLSGQEERLKWIYYYLNKKKENTDGKVD